MYKRQNQTLRDVLKGTYDCGYELGVASSDGYYPPDKKYVKEELDQALKEISELLVECKPEKLGTVGTWSDTGQKVLAGRDVYKRQPDIRVFVCMEQNGHKMD